MEGSRGAGPLVLKLSGAVWKERLGDVQRAVEAARTRGEAVMLDCREVVRVDRRAVRFLAENRARGVALVEAPGFLRFWVEGCM